MRSKGGLALLAGLCVACLVAAPALAAPTRAEYIAQADPICASRNAEMKAALHGVASDFRQGRGKSASRKFRRATNVFEETTNQLAALEAPTADATLIAQWLGLLRSQIPLARRVSRVLQHQAAEKKINRALNALYRRSDRTQALVDDYGFTACQAV